MDTPLFYILLFVHLTSLILAFGAVMVTDHFGLAWMRDKVPFERLVKSAGTTQRLIWIGWGGLVVAGIGLLTLKGFIDNLTWIKIYCVALAGVNGYVLHRILKSVKRHEDSDAVPTAVMFRLGLSLMISQVAWWGAFLIGFLHRHVRSRIEWPPLPWLWMVLFSTLVLLTWLAGERYLRRHPSRVKVESSDEAERIERGPGPTLDPLGKES